jgi:hypothetical protein
MSCPVVLLPFRFATIVRLTIVRRRVEMEEDYDGLRATMTDVSVTVTSAER